MNIPNGVRFVMDRLDQNGFEVYIVGGAVRDDLMGKAPTDFDLTTSAEPQEILQLFNDCKLVCDGLKHGTVTVIVNHVPIEVTTYRTDGDYSDNRHPNSVRFTKSLAEDLARRDFTVNAMAYHPKKGIVDLFGGKQDLENKVLRTVGNPEKRFTEDALRILRAVRFVATLGFLPEKETENELYQYAAHLRAISRERILAELKKILSGEHTVLALQRYLYVLLCADAHFSTVLGNGIDPVRFETVAQCENSFAERLAAMFLCMVRAENECYAPLNLLEPLALKQAAFNNNQDCKNIESALQALKADRKTTKQVVKLCYYARVFWPQDETEIHRLCTLLDQDTVQSVCRIKKAFGFDETGCAEFLPKALHILANECCSMEQLAIGGKDLNERGITGIAVGEKLQQAFCAVIEKRCPNEKQALLDYILK